MCLIGCNHDAYRVGCLINAEQATVTLVFYNMLGLDFTTLLFLIWEGVMYNIRYTEIAQNCCISKES